MSKTILIRGLMLGATAFALSGCYAGYEEQPATTAYSYGYESGYPTYGGYYYGPSASAGFYYGDQEAQGDLGPRRGKGF